MPVFPAIFERVAGNLLSVDGSATQLPAIWLALLLGVDAPSRSTGVPLLSAAESSLHYNVIIKQTKIRYYLLN